MPTAMRPLTGPRSTSEMEITSRSWPRRCERAARRIMRDPASVSRVCTESMVKRRRSTPLDFHARAASAWVRMLHGLALAPHPPGASGAPGTAPEGANSPSGTPVACAGVAEATSTTVLRVAAASDADAHAVPRKPEGTGELEATLVHTRLPIPPGRHGLRAAPEDTAPGSAQGSRPKVAGAGGEHPGEQQEGGEGGWEGTGDADKEAMRRRRELATLGSTASASLGRSSDTQVGGAAPEGGSTAEAEVQAPETEGATDAAARSSHQRRRSPCTIACADSAQCTRASVAMRA
mmetsp:Transcript_21449/g.67062  ORF Transcript_21449/g.67062 Transcript_21449/m.67062 type:complete len:292 (+) Transcript_21449:1053-1928(+)